MIAESYAEYMAGKSYVYHFANQMDLEQVGTRLDSDGVKLFCAPMGKRVADHAIQVCSLVESNATDGGGAGAGGCVVLVRVPLLGCHDVMTVCCRRQP